MDATPRPRSVPETASPHIAANPSRFTPGRVRLELQLVEPAERKRLLEALGLGPQPHPGREQEGMAGRILFPLRRGIPSRIHQFATAKPVRRQERIPTRIRVPNVIMRLEFGAPGTTAKNPPGRLRPRPASASRSRERARRRNPEPGAFLDSSPRLPKPSSGQMRSAACPLLPSRLANLNLRSRRHPASESPVSCLDIPAPDLARK